MPGFTARTLFGLLTAFLVGCALLACGDSGSDAGPAPSDTAGDTSTTTTTDSTTPQEPAVYEGQYSVGFEVSEFVPCGSKEHWWLVGTEELVAQVQGNRPGRQPTSPALIRVRGELSEPGTYGHLGMYERELTVTEVLEVTPDGAC